MQNGRSSLSAAIVGLLGFSLTAGAAVKLPNVISNHMVLQRDMPVPIWGTAAAGEKVTVRFRDQEKTVEAGSDGNWSVKLDSLKPGGPGPLVVVGSNTINLDDVLVGDVWIGSGQSNMAIAAAQFIEHDEALAKNVLAGPYPKLRVIKPGGTWQEGTPKVLHGFSALLLSFGLPVQKEIDQPVGLMEGAVGGRLPGPG